MARFGVKEVADVTFFNLLTGKPELYLDTLKLSNLENGAESVFANGGKGAPRLVGWDFGRTVAFNIQDALLNPKAISMQLGTELENKKANIFAREYKASVSDGDNSVVTLENKITTNGKIQPTVYISVDGIAHGTEIPTASITIGDATVGEKEVSTLTIPSATLPIGDAVLVYYQYETVSDAEVITVSSDKFAGYYMAVGDTLWRNEATGKDEKVQIVIPKAKITSTFNLTMQPDGEPSVFDFNLDVFKDSGSTDMVKMIRYN